MLCPLVLLVKQRLCLQQTVGRSSGQSVVVSSPSWGSLPYVSQCTETCCLSSSGTPSDESAGLSIVWIRSICRLGLNKFGCSRYWGYLHSTLYTLRARSPPVQASYNTIPYDTRELYIKIQFVPRSKCPSLGYKTSQLMLYREIVAVCSQIHTKHINTLCGQNVELYIKTQSVPRSNKLRLGYTNQSVNAV
jgi:hypothetical protein